MGNNCGIFSTTCTDGNFISFFEKLIVDDGLMNFSLKIIEKAFLANGLQVFRPFDEGSLLMATLAHKLGHEDFLLYLLIIINIWDSQHVPMPSTKSMKNTSL